MSPRCSTRSKIRTACALPISCWRHSAACFTWFASRNEDYTSPIIRGMRRQAPSTAARARILNDAEIRKLWEVTGDGHPFSAMMRLALLTAQRRERLMSLKWSDIDIGGVWNIVTAEREKGAGGALQLPAMALDVIRSQPRLNDYVFAGRGEGAFNGMSKAKLALDAKLGFSDWTIHDLRRSARSLMARAGVADSIAERTLGHVQGGVAGIYNRHDYQAEKADALAKLAGLLATIINPVDNVVPIKRTKAPV